MAWTSLIYDHFDLHLTPVTFTFNLPEKMFQMALLFLEDNNCAKLFWNVTFIWPLWPWPSTYLKNVSNGTSPPRGQQLCKIILKSMHKCTSYGPDKLNIWPFWPLFDPCDLDLQPTWKNVSIGTFSPQGQQVCIIILKSMHKCTSYCPDKLNIYDHFDLYLTPVTLTFTIPIKMFQMALLLLKGNNCAKLFWNPCILYKLWSRQIQTDAHTYTEQKL